MAAIVGNPLPPLLASLCAQLRSAGNAPGVLGEQAAAAIETLWADNRRLSMELLEIKRGVERAITESAAIGEFGMLRSTGGRRAR